MFTASLIEVEMQHQRREMLRHAEQQRLINEIKQASPRPMRNRLSLNSLLSVIRPTEARQTPPRLALKSR
jgi:hypothetical protein